MSITCDHHIAQGPVLQALCGAGRGLRRGLVILVVAAFFCWSAVLYLFRSVFGGLAHALQRLLPHRPAGR